jgi:hypothetical protein
MGAFSKRLGILVLVLAGCTSRGRTDEAVRASGAALGAAGAGGDEPMYVWQQKVLRPTHHSREMVYDRARQRTFMWDAHSESISRFVTSMWEWNGSVGTWAQRPESSEALRNADRYFSAGGARVYDTTRNKMVIPDSLNGFWEWDGGAGTWTLRGQPDARLHWAFGMIYDAERQKFVIVSAENSTAYNVHVFEWDPSDASFSERTTTGAPPGRLSSAVAWDAARRKVVMFGGLAASLSSRLSDIWEWDPTTGAWEERHPTRPGPQARWTYAVAYHEAREHVFVFGGSDPAPMNDLWEWDGAAGEWISHPFGATSAVPAGGVDYSLVYDSTRETLELFGSTFSVSETSGAGGLDTFDWDDDAQIWIDRRTPAGRQAPSLAYDPASARTVLFGGSTSDNTFNDVWGYDGATEVWHQNAIPAPRPLARWFGSLVADERRETLLLIGGSAGAMNGTWELDAIRGTWTDRTPASGGPVAHFATAAYDSIRGKVLFFGGEVGRPVNNDLWEWDGDDGTWMLLPIENPKPAPRDNVLSAFDAARNRYVVFGGYDSVAGKTYDDTWEWNPSDSTWTERLPVGSFGLDKGVIGMFYDALRERVVMVGSGPDSGDLLRDVWEWDGGVGNWGHVSIATDPVPPTRANPGLAFDPVRRAAVLFSGFSSFDRTDTWELHVSCPASSPTCVTTPPPPDAGTGTGGSSLGGSGGSSNAGADAGGASGSSTGGSSNRGGAGNAAGSSNAGEGPAGEGGEEAPPSRSSDDDSGCGCRVHSRGPSRA